MTPLVGREVHLAEVAAHLREGRSVLVSGARGTGRSSVLAEAARNHGGSVLAVRALPGDQALPGAGLQRLLAPVQDRAAQLPPPQAAVFAALFGIDPPAAAPVPLSEAVCALSRTLSADGQLWVIDDLDRLDELSRTVLLGLDRPLLATAVSHQTAPALAAVQLGPLSPPDAEQVLRALPGVQEHPAARLVARQSRGLPLALIELARNLPPAAEVSPLATELPVSPRLRRALAPSVDGLDQHVLRAALLVAFATETPAPEIFSALKRLIPEDAWEELMTHDVLPSRRRFGHPVVRAAVLDRAGPVLRQAIRLELVAGLPEDHVARAWHVARADPSPDESCAAILDRTGDQLARAGHARAAAYALGFAAARSSDRDAGRRRSARAADQAQRAGEVRWSTALAPSEPISDVRLPQALKTAWLQGDAHSREQLREALGDGCADHDDILVTWARAVAEDTDPLGHIRRLLHTHDRLDQAGSRPPHERSMALGAMAVARHESALAVRFLTRALELTRPGGPDRAPTLNALAWARYDVGQFDAARTVARQVLTEGSAAPLAADVRAGALALLAAVATLRDEADRKERLSAARGSLQIFQHAAYDVRLNRAQGLADALAGRYDLAFHWLRHQYSGTGTPIHHRLSDLGLADLTQVAVVLGRQDQVAPIVAGAERRIRTLGSARATAIWHRARALLAGSDPAAEADYRRSVTDGVINQWPVESALARMDYASWLRRQLRPAQSRPLLRSARDVFATTGVPGWQERAEAELAAAAPPPRPGGAPAQGLTSQQREVVRLAALGLTNQQIAERLALSARTISTHLSRSYAVLGITRRTQLNLVRDRL